ISLHDDKGTEIAVNEHAEEGEVGEHLMFGRELERRSPLRAGLQCIQFMNDDAFAGEYSCGARREQGIETGCLIVEVQTETLRVELHFDELVARIEREVSA